MLLLYGSRVCLLDLSKLRGLVGSPPLSPTTSLHLNRSGFCCLWFYVVLSISIHHKCIFIFQPCISLPSVNSRYLIDIHGLHQELKYLWRQKKPLSFTASCAVSCLIVIALPLLTYCSYLPILALSLFLFMLYQYYYIHLCISRTDRQIDRCFWAVPSG